MCLMTIKQARSEVCPMTGEGCIADDCIHWNSKASVTRLPRESRMFVTIALAQLGGNAADEIIEDGDEIICPAAGKCEI